MRREWNFPEAPWYVIFQPMTIKSDTRLQLSSSRSDIKRLAKMENNAMLASHYFILHKNVFFGVLKKVICVNIQ